jgi:hypothetical protein
VDEVIDRWVAPDRLCFRVKVLDRAYLLQYHQAQDIWEAELVKSGTLPPAGGEN